MYDIGQDRVLMLVKDERMLLQIQDFLNRGSNYLVDTKFRLFISSECAAIRRRVLANRRKATSGSNINSQGKQTYRLPGKSSNKSEAEDTVNNFMGLGMYFFFYFAFFF